MYTILPLSSAVRQVFTLDLAPVPRNATGKIEKPKLRRMYGGEGLVDSQNRS